jgi:hypothetical protein
MVHAVGRCKDGASAPVAQVQAQFVHQALQNGEFLRFPSFSADADLPLAKRNRLGLALSLIWGGFFALSVF